MNQVSTKGRVQTNPAIFRLKSNAYEGDHVVIEVGTHSPTRVASSQATDSRHEARACSSLGAKSNP